MVSDNWVRDQKTLHAYSESESMDACGICSAGATTGVRIGEGGRRDAI